MSEGEFYVTRELVLRLASRLSCPGKVLLPRRLGLGLERPLWQNVSTAPEESDGSEDNIG